MRGRGAARPRRSGAPRSRSTLGVSPRCHGDRWEAGRETQQKGGAGPRGAERVGWDQTGEEEKIQPSNNNKKNEVSQPLCKGLSETLTSPDPKHLSSFFLSFSPFPSLISTPSLFL